MVELCNKIIFELNWIFIVMGWNPHSFSDQFPSSNHPTLPISRVLGPASLEIWLETTRLGHSALFAVTVDWYSFGTLARLLAPSRSLAFLFARSILNVDSDKRCPGRGRHPHRFAVMQVTSLQALPTPCFPWTPPVNYMQSSVLVSWLEN